MESLRKFNLPFICCIFLILCPHLSLAQNMRMQTINTVRDIKKTTQVKQNDRIKTKRTSPPQESSASAVVNPLPKQRIKRVIPRLTDLSIDRFHLSSSKISSGEKITLYAEVKNSGDTALRNVKITFTQGSKVLGEKRIAINPGATAKTEITKAIIGKGKLSIVAAVDPDQQIAERDKKNNSSQAFITLVPARVSQVNNLVNKMEKPGQHVRTSRTIKQLQIRPQLKMDLLPHELKLDSHEYVAGESVVVKVMVRSTAGIELTKVPIAYFLDGKKIGSANASVTPNWYYEPSYKFTAYKAGKHTLSIKIDPENVYDELNEKNNTAIVHFTVNQLKLAAIPSSQQKQSFDNSSARENKAVKNKIKNHPEKTGNSHTTPGISGHSSGNDGTNRYGMPGGIQEPGAGNTPSPFDEDNSVIPDINNPTGMGNPGDKIVTPDQMDEHTPGGSYGNLYGGVNPARDPRQGGGKGKDPNGFHATGMSASDFGLISGVENSGHEWAEVDQWQGTTNIKVFWDNGNCYDSYVVIGTNFVYVGTYDSKTGEKISEGRTDEGAGDTGEKKPWSEEAKRNIREALLAQAYEDTQSGPAVTNDGGVVDPVRNQANSGDNANNGSKSQTGEQKQFAAKQPGSQKPGSALTGGGRIDTDKTSTQLKLPQGFHVIDPLANIGATAGKVDSGEDADHIEVSLNNNDQNQ